jgi:hypothetical protein
LFARSTIASAWKALITSVQLGGTDPRKAKKARQSICDILDDHS